MWVPSDLESDSELEEEVGDDQGDTVEVSEDEENEEMDLKTNELSPDESNYDIVAVVVLNHENLVHTGKIERKSPVMHNQRENSKIFLLVQLCSCIRKKVSFKK